MNQSRKQRAEDWFGPVEPARTSDRVAEAIRRTIVEGKLAPGDALPPERTLAERFRVTRNTVREALKSLQQARLVTIRQGSGARVLDYLANAGFEFITSLFGSGTAGERRLVADLVEARAVVGCAIYHHAIDHFDPAALPDVAEAVDTLESEAGRERPEVRRLQELDFEVQHRLLRGGPNRTFVLLHNSIRHVYARLAHLFEPLVEDPEGLVARYRALLDHLASGDHQAARQVITDIFSDQQKAMTHEHQEPGRGYP